MKLSEEAKAARREAERKSWLKKAVEYGISTDGREEEAIKEARRIYTADYWERRAQQGR